MDATTQELKKGMIILWSGSVATIPSGWALCNGSNGTPDLRNRFVVCAGGAYPVDNTGGSSSHLHTITDPSHGHYLDGGSNVAAGEDYADYAGDNSTGITVDYADNKPLYYALAFIMKL